MKHKAWYFRVLGVIEILGCIGLLIWWLIDTIGAVYVSRGWSIGINIVLLVLILFFGPAFALLLFGHADMLEKVFPEDNAKTHEESYHDRAEDISSRLNSLKSVPGFAIGDKVMIRYLFIDPSTNIEVRKGSKGKVIRATDTSCCVEFIVNGRIATISGRKENFLKLK